MASKVTRYTEEQFGDERLLRRARAVGAALGESGHIGMNAKTARHGASLVYPTL